MTSANDEWDFSMLNYGIKRLQYSRGMSGKEYEAIQHTIDFIKCMMIKIGDGVD